MMHRLLFTVAAVSLTVLTAGPALASSCPKLIAQINAAAGNRFDAASHQAKDKAAQAQKLHAEGKHAESEKTAKEGLALLGVKM
jgi:hypothetical protein